MNRRSRNRGRRARIALVTAACAAGAVAAMATPASAYNIHPPVQPMAPQGVHVDAAGYLSWSPAWGATSYLVYRDGSWVGTTSATSWQDPVHDGVAHTYKVASFATGESLGGLPLSSPVSEPPLNLKAQADGSFWGLGASQVCWDAVADHNSSGNDAYIVYIEMGGGAGTFVGRFSGQTCYDISQMVPDALKGDSVKVTVESATDNQGAYVPESDPSTAVDFIYG